MDHEIYHGDVDEGFAGLWERLVVFGEAPMASQPSEGALHDPPAREYLERVRLRAPDDLEDPAAERLRPRDEWTGIPGIRPDQAQTGEALFQFWQHQLRAIAVLNIGRMNHDRQHQPKGIDHQVSFAPGHFLPGVVPARPPFSVVRTLWLSIMAALGVDGRPARWRTRSRNTPIIRAQTPSSRHWRA